MSVSNTSAITSHFAIKSAIPKLITISEPVWRNAASQHRRRIRSLLQPGLTSPKIQLDSSARKRRQHMLNAVGPLVDDWTALDRNNPIYNFLIEYYGLKGVKGPKRLSRWSPDPSLLLLDDSTLQTSDLHGIRIQNNDNEVSKAAMKASHGFGGILLENATEDDIGGILHLRGATPIIDYDNQGQDQNSKLKYHGILFNPALFYNHYETSSLTSSEEREQQQQQLFKTFSSFQWYFSVLQRTLQSEPVLHCHGLHEWAMQYHPDGCSPPPSAKYQSHLRSRVSQDVINSTVERQGVHCTHIDAVKYFAPSALPLNHYGSTFERKRDQTRLEQKACVHANMDLLKMVLKLQPFVNTDLVADALEISLAARQLDVAASPYDATAYGVDAVPVETEEGRQIYRKRQRKVMEEAEPVRERLLDSYRIFINLAFDRTLQDDSVITSPVPTALRHSNKLP